MKIGIQLYSLRQEIEQDGVDTVLAAVRDAGFRFVELAGYYGLSPDALKAKMDAHGLSGMSAHVGVGGFSEQLPYLKALGLTQIYIPALDTETLLSESLEKQVKPMLELAEANGIRVGYHNHAHEYEGGRDLVKTLIDRLPALTVQLDVFWAIVAGHDPVALMQRYRPALSSVHVKEPDLLSGGAPTDLPNPVPGSGGAGMDKIVAAAAREGVTDFVLEVEGFPCPYRAYLTDSYRALAKMTDTQN